MQGYLFDPLQGSCIPLIGCSGLIFRIRIQQALSPQGAHKAVDFCKRHRKAKELKNKGGQKTMKEREHRVCS